MKKKEYIRIINKYQEKYSKKIVDLRREYLKSVGNIEIKKFIELNKMYRNLIKQLIIEVVHEFSDFLDINFIVALNGSLAGSTNTLYSDIDLNYLTDSNNYGRIIELEDKVNYILQRVLNFRGKDRIHSFVVYLPLVSNKKLRYFKTNRYPIKFEDGKIYCKCRKNAQKLMFETYNSTRNIYSVIDYLNENDNINNINEWSNCFEIIYDNNLAAEFYKNRKICKSKKNIDVHIMNAINLIRKDIYLKSEVKNIKNYEFKKIYVTKVLENVYNVFAIKYRLNKMEKFDAESLKKSKMLSKKFFEAFYTYLNCIQAIQMILDHKGFDLSSHSKKKLNIKQISKDYSCIFNNNLLNTFNKKKKELYNWCVSELKKVGENK